MTIALDATCSGSCAPGNSITMSLTSVANAVLYVCIGGLTSSQTVTGITSDGTALFRDEIEAVTNRENSIWRLSFPKLTAGAHTIVCSLSGGGTAYMQAFGASFINTESDPRGAKSIITASSSLSVTDSITTGRPNSYIIDAVTTYGNTSALTAAGSQVQIGQINDGVGSVSGAASYLATTTIGSKSMGWSKTGTSNDWLHCMTEILAPVTQPTGGFFASD